MLLYSRFIFGGSAQVHPLCVGNIIGYFISAIVSKQMSSLVGVVFSLIWAIAFSGVEPSIKKADEDKNLIRYLFEISAPRWAISAFYLQETGKKSYQNINVGLDNYGYENDSYEMDILYIFLIGIGWQILAFLMLKLINRDKQK